MNPPVPGVEASRKVSGDTHREFPAVSITWLSETPCCCMRCGSTRIWSCRSRCPQIATFATPGTLSRRGRMVQCASTDISMSDTSFEDRPTIITRLEEESG
jgi:hypothetical protein